MRGVPQVFEQRDMQQAGDRQQTGQDRYRKSGQRRGQCRDVETRTESNNALGSTRSTGCLRRAAELGDSTFEA